MELASCAFEHEEVDNGGADCDAGCARCGGFCVARFLAVAVEGVWVWVGGDGHAGPAVAYYFGGCGVDVWVCG